MCLIASVQGLFLVAQALWDVVWGGVITTSV